MERYFKLKNLIGSFIKDATLIVYPPLFLDDLNQSDISLNLYFDSYGGFTFSTDENLWTAIFRSEYVQAKYDFNLFYDRMNFWMRSEQAEKEPIEIETFDLKNSNEFDFLFNNPLTSIRLLNISDKNEVNPFGFELQFNGKSLYSRSGHDGNIIQTDTFIPEPNPLVVNAFLGDVEFIDI